VIQEAVVKIHEENALEPPNVTEVGLSDTESRLATPMSGLAVQCTGVTVRVPTGQILLDTIDWEVRAGEHWALLGPNGAGKSTLLSLAGASRHPSSGTVTVLGETLGRTDMRELRGRIGVVDQALRLPARMTVLDVILTGATGTVLPLPERYTQADHERAAMLVELLDLTALTGREIGSCSQGERGRARLARALLPEPPLLLLDEPATGLDLPSREALMRTLDTSRAAHPEVATVLVSHHVEELPASTSHALLLRAGQAVASGPATGVLANEPLSECFGMTLHIRHTRNRWTAVAVH
jgi:iron complex transport system ATP-binding protein